MNVGSLLAFVIKRLLSISKPENVIDPENIEEAQPHELV